MSCSAAKPSALATWSPSRASRQKRQSSGSEYPLLRDGRAADADELADRRVDEPRRIVVAVAAAGAVDQDDVLPADLAAPALETRVVRRLTEPRAPFTLHGDGHRIVGRRSCPGPRRVREDVHLRRPRGGDDVERFAKRALVLRRKADDHVGREVEVLAERSDTVQIRPGGVATCHVAKNAVVAGLQRNVQVPTDGRRLAQGAHELVSHVVDLDRREPQARDSWDCPGFTDEPREPIAVVAVAVAA